MTKPRHETPAHGPSLARRIVALELREPYKTRGLVVLADELGVSMATLYRWKAGEVGRIGRAVARRLADVEGAK